jgi:hypothetical protein
LGQQTQFLEFAIKMRRTKINADQQGRRSVCQRGIRQMQSGRWSVFSGIGRIQIHSAARHNGRNGMFVNHLGYSVSQQDNILIKGLNLTLQLDAIDQINRNGDMLSAQGIEEGILQELAFVAHDMLRVQKKL